MGHIDVGHRWDRVAMDLYWTCLSPLQKAIGTLWLWWTVSPDGRKRVRCLTRQHCWWLMPSIVCRFGMPMVIHSDQGLEFENKFMQELCLLCGSHKTRTTMYHPESDGLVERFNRTLLMMLAMFAGENRDDWDDLLPAVLMAYRSSVHESTGFSPYRLMFGEESTLPMDVGLPLREPDLPDPISSPYAVYGFVMRCKWHTIRSVDIRDRRYSATKDSKSGPTLIRRGQFGLALLPSCKEMQTWVGPYLVVSLAGWALGIQRHPDSLIVLVQSSPAWWNDAVD